MKLINLFTHKIGPDGETLGMIIALFVPIILAIIWHSLIGIVVLYYIFGGIWLLSSAYGK